MSHTVAFEGTERDGIVQVAKNVIGYRDPAANALLFGIYQGELLQIVGRMRGQLVDPVDPSIVATVHLIAGVAIPGWRVDEVITLDELRGRLGLTVRKSRARCRTSKVSLEEQIKRRWQKHGPVPTMEWLVKVYSGVTNNDAAVTAARLAIERAGAGQSRRACALDVRSSRALSPARRGACAATGARLARPTLYD